MDNLWIIYGWLNPTSLKNIKVKWDDDIPNTVYGKIENVPNHQPVITVLM